MFASAARTLGQNDWPETTQKLIPPHKTRDCKPGGGAVLLGSLALPETAQKRIPPHKTRDCKPGGGAVLLGSLTLLLSSRAPLPIKVSCAVSMCVSSDNSLPSVRQEPTVGPQMGSLFPQHLHLQ